MDTGEHTPVRPSWTCTACEEDWPCVPAREKLCAEYGDQKVNLAVYMATQLGHAAADLTEATPTQLYERFIAWTRP
ncbi:flavin reductase [Actinomycetes bacterium KLBMP 9797]